VIEQRIASPLFGAEYHKRGTRGAPQCAMCGRALRTGRKTTYWVHYLTSGDLTTSQDPNHPETQGWWELGSECRKAIPSAFVFVTANANVER